jgi:asparagine synthase (glutamine-hydrolysing)
MCGIATLWNMGGRKIQLSEIDLLTDAVAHRGPDGRGTWINSTATLALGHRRLAILDLSTAGHQPMSGSGGRYRITYNGEIYNFLEIRQQLQAAGHTFHSNTDTEVILAAYHQWGESMLGRFNGMWAFVIYDQHKDELFIARDRFGVKPLYYYSDQNLFIVSSEVQAIHRYLGARHPLNRTVVSDVAEGSFASFATEQTYLQDVYSLPAGHRLRVNRVGRHLQQWYHLSRIDVPASFTQQKEALRNILTDACVKRLISDVEVGTCLSGGVDSSAITSIIHGLQAHSVRHKAFCASFPNTPSDESEQARRLAKELQIELLCSSTEAPSVEELEGAMGASDGPMMAFAFFPIWKLYRFIRRNGVTVTLDGQGPDEMLGGYRPVADGLRGARELGDWRWYWDVYRTYRAQGESLHLSSRRTANQALFADLREAVTVRRTLGLRAFPNSLAATTCPNTKLIPIRNERPFSNSFDNGLYRQFFQNPLPGLLHLYDRCSMMNGVECRMPFLDYRLVEFVFSLPPQAKVGHGYTKRILREAMRGIVPDETLNNRQKIGFNGPIVDWLRGPLREWAQDHMASKSFQECEYFNGPKLRDQFEQFAVAPHPLWNTAWRFFPALHTTLWLQKVNRELGEKHRSQNSENLNLMLP